MLIKERKLKGLFEIDLDTHEDQRGFFVRTYDDKIFRKYGLHRDWVQENHSYSRKKGTIRGLHFQFAPHAETKLVRAMCGKIFMVSVDLRKGISTFGHWDNIIISGKNKKMLYIPRGFALGMCTLSDDCILLYKMDNYYVPESQGIIRWDDPDIGIKWPVSIPTLSERDAGAPSFRNFIEKCGGLEL